MTVETFLGKVAAELDPPVRGDPITSDRYYSKEWMQKEWDKVWTRIWHIGGLASDLVDEGDYITHNFLRESILMIKQADGSVKAFYNSCLHRGNRLVWSEIGGAPSITCSYHGWRWAPDGRLIEAQDAEDFPQGNPCDHVRLSEVACEVWGGFVWFNMDTNAKPLAEWLSPLTDILAGYQMETMKRVMYLTAEVDCNWKIIRDNFNESYHLPTLHPELATFIDDDYTDTVFEMYPSGHNRMVQKGCIPSARADVPEAMQAPLDDILKEWDLNPTDFEDRARAARKAVQDAKRRLGPARGFKHFDTLTDSQLTDYYHHTLWPNLTFTMSPDGFQVLRSEPHPTDPEKCIFDHWFFMPPVEGRSEVMTPLGMRPFVDAEREYPKPGDSLGFVADQDLSIITGQQQGLHSRGYKGGILSKQEKRVQRFHEILNDHIEGRV